MYILQKFESGLKVLLLVKGVAGFSNGNIDLCSTIVLCRVNVSHGLSTVRSNQLMNHIHLESP